MCFFFLQTSVLHLSHAVYLVDVNAFVVPRGQTAVGDRKGASANKDRGALMSNDRVSKHRGEDESRRWSQFRTWGKTKQSFGGETDMLSQKDNSP